jgi:hypothetical protein
MIVVAIETRVGYTKSLKSIESILIFYYYILSIFFICDSK